jgi:hypothetical protein
MTIWSLKKNRKERRVVSIIKRYQKSKIVWLKLLLINDDII